MILLWMMVMLMMIIASCPPWVLAAVSFWVCF